MFRTFAFSFDRESGGLGGLGHDELGGRCWERLAVNKDFGWWLESKFLVKIKILKRQSHCWDWRFSGRIIERTQATTVP